MKIRQTKIGTIISTKMQNTVVIMVETRKAHPKYKKIVKKINKFKAHSEKDDLKAGDKVKIEASRPMSKDKHWKVIEKLN